MSRTVSHYGSARMHLICWLLLCLFALIHISCGARKSTVGIEKEKTVEESKTKDESKSSSQGQTTKENATSDQSKDSEENKNVEENLKKTIREIYNENGTLKERITELEKIKTDKSTSKQKESLKTSYLRTDSVFNVTNYRLVTITKNKEQESFKKDKQTDANNNALYLSIFGVLVILILIYFLYRYLTRPKL